MEASEFLSPGAPNPTLRSLEFLRLSNFFDLSNFRPRVLTLHVGKKFPLQFGTASESDVVVANNSYAVAPRVAEVEKRARRAAFTVSSPMPSRQ
jgi:hypothetical protein